jgi:hypothetical protein
MFADAGLGSLERALVWLPGLGLSIPMALLVGLSAGSVRLVSVEDSAL